MTTATATQTAAACACELTSYTVTGIHIIERINNACPQHGFVLPSMMEFTHRGFTCTPDHSTPDRRWTIAGDAQANRSYRKVFGIKADGVVLEGLADAVRQQLDNIMEQAAPRPALKDCKGWRWDEAKQRRVKCQATLDRYSQSHYCSNCRQA